MLLKTSNGDKTSYVASNNGKGKRSISSRIHRKTLRVASKPSSGKRVHIGKRISLGKNQKNFNGSFPPTTSSLCDNSNDSGLGFDHHESQHILQPHPVNNTNSQIMALTTAPSTNLHNNCNNSNSNNNNSSANYQRSMNTIRYGEITQANYASSTTPTSPTTTSFITKNKHCIQLGAGKKIKSVIKKPFMPVKNTNHLTLKNETEDTCGDDFFSTHVQKNNMNNTASSPTSLTYSSVTSPSEKSSSSSPTTSLSSNRSSPEITNNLQLSINLTSETTESLDEVQSSSLTSLQNQNYSAVSRDGTIQLQIVTQPEQQHRARYQTEGSRGAVKDKSGNGFPVVKLNGYSKPAVLQVFIGNDVGRVSPHIFYQACKVSGKNSTPCNEVKVDGTMVIEIEIKPDNDMTVICDCVGILKERNVDVEHRLGKNNNLAATVTRNKKKSTKCRMIFRAKINEDTDYPEVLQICSNTITCTQPPGVPEICKKSLDSCSTLGGKELFIIGKNFLKDTKVTFTRYDENGRQAKKVWEETVLPDKEYLQQTHLICTIPAYPDDDLTEPVQVQIYVTSSNKKSEPHTFIYLPLKNYRSIPQSPSIDTLTNISFTATTQQDLSPTSGANPLLSLTWNEPQVTTPENIMAPPPITGVSSRKPSFSKQISEGSTNDTAKITNSNDLQQEATTSSPLTIQPIQQASVVKEMIHSDSAMIDVTGQCFLNPTTSNLMNSGQALLDEFQVVHHIKTEQNQDQQQNVMPPPSQQPPQTSELNSAQQQQVVENFINMICAQVEPTIVQQNTENIINHHLNQDLIMNQTSNNVAATTNNNTMNNVIQPDHSGNMMSAISSQPMICEQNIMSVQLPDGTKIIPLNTLDASINNDTNTNTTLISNAVCNAVCEAALETQAAVKQMIASVTAEILSENPNETQSSINNFISSTLGTETTQQQQTQIISTQQQQLQEIIAQELLTPVMIKKEENEGQPQNVQDALISDSTSNNPSTSAITQPFSPTPADFNLTTMSESDLISFINPSVFI